MPRHPHAQSVVALALAEQEQVDVCIRFSLSAVMFLIFLVFIDEEI